jgi:hypothetical protein
MISSGSVPTRRSIRPAGTDPHQAGQGS